MDEILQVFKKITHWVVYDEGWKLLALVWAVAVYSWGKWKKIRASRSTNQAKKRLANLELLRSQMDSPEYVQETQWQAAQRLCGALLALAGLIAVQGLVQMAAQNARVGGGPWTAAALGKLVVDLVNNGLFLMAVTFSALAGRGFGNLRPNAKNEVNTEIIQLKKKLKQTLAPSAEASRKVPE
jgi:hypothetical protein